MPAGHTFDCDFVEESETDAGWVMVDGSEGITLIEGINSYDCCRSITFALKLFYLLH